MPQKRTLERTVYPFKVGEGALDRCALRLAGSDAFDPHVVSFDLDPSGEPDALHPELFLSLSPAHVEEKAGLPARSMRLWVVEEHSMARITRVAATWQLHEVPQSHRIDFAPEAYGSQSFSLRLAIALAEQRDRAAANGTAWRRGSLLCEKAFVIRRPTSTSLLPVRNTSFAAQGWEPSAIWYVQWHDLQAPHEASCEEALEVHLNKDLPALQALWSSSARRNPSRRPTANMVQRTIGAAILAEVSVAILGKLFDLRSGGTGEVDIADESIAGALLANLTDALNTTRDHLIELAGQKPGDLTRRIQALVDCGKVFGVDALHDIDAVGEGLR